jgi:RNA ligase
MTEISTKSVWECLSKGDNIYEMLKDVPDEFFKGIEKYIDELTNHYITIERDYNWIFNKLRNIYFDAHKKEYNRAEFAQRAKVYKHPQILFKMLDDKDPSDTIWRIIKPEYKKL